MAIEFSKFVMPNASGVPTYLYQVKDPVARSAIAAGMRFIIAWNGETTPDVSKIPNVANVTYNGVVYTGTLDPAVAHNNVPIGFWLVATGEGEDSFSEYAPVTDDDVTPAVWRWEKFGNVGLNLSDLGALAYMDSVELEKGSGVNVIGENATLQAQDSSVSFGQHTKKRALGENATFSVSGPAVSADRKKIKTIQVTGVNGTESVNGNLSPSYKKLKRTSISPAKSKRISADDLVKYSVGKMNTKQINVPNAATNVNILTDFTKRKLETKDFPVSAPANTNPTVTGLDIRMYNPSVHGTIEGADEETLVIAFGTTPTLQLSANAPSRIATGALVADGSDGSQAHTDYTNETGGEIVNGATKSTQAIVSGTSSTSVADGTISAASASDTNKIVTEIDLSETIEVAETDTDVMLATGELVAEGEQGYSSAAAGDGNKLMVGGSVSVTVPKADNETNVLTDVWENADNDITHMNVTRNVSQQGSYNVTVQNADVVDAITGLGEATAAAQSVSFANKDIKKVALYDDLKIKTESHPATRYLNFVTPNGGMISLNKIGSPASNVSLEYSLDGVNWTAWNADIETGNRSVQAAAGERVYIRSTSSTTTRFSLSDSDYYQFSLPDGTQVAGIIESLLCRTPEFGEIGNSGNTRCHLTNLFRNCKIIGRPIINSKTLKERSLENTFRNTQTLQEIEIHTLVKGTAALSGWLIGCAASGTIYAPAALTLSENSESGIPSGWTRSDID